MSDELIPYDLGVSEPPGGFRNVVKRSTLPVVTDPAMPPGAFALRSDSEQLIHVSAVTQAIADTASSDLLAEDCRSLLESADYVVRYREHGTPVTCECCGTTVALMPEAIAGADWQGRDFKPGIWEPEAGRKHTLRRCEWKRANP